MVILGNVSMKNDNPGVPSNPFPSNWSGGRNAQESAPEGHPTIAQRFQRWVKAHKTQALEGRPNSHAQFSDRNGVVRSLRPRLVPAHPGGPVHAIFGTLHLKMDLVGARKYVDRAMVHLFPIVGFIAGIDPTISHNFEAAPIAGATILHAQRLIMVGVTAIFQGMRRQENYQRHVLAVDELIAREEL